MLAKPVTCEPLKLGVLAWMTSSRRNFAFGLRLVDNLSNIVADDLGQAGRVHSNHLGIIDGEDVLDRFQEVGLSPKTDAPSVNELVVAMIGSL